MLLPEPELLGRQRLQGEGGRAKKEERGAMDGRKETREEGTKRDCSPPFAASLFSPLPFLPPPALLDAVR